jgi:hypothetical protein
MAVSLGVHFDAAHAWRHASGTSAALSMVSLSRTDLPCSRDEAPTPRTERRAGLNQPCTELRAATNLESNTELRSFIYKPLAAEFKAFSPPGRDWAKSAHGAALEVFDDVSSL